LSLSLRQRIFARCVLRDAAGRLTDLGEPRDLAEEDATEFAQVGRGARAATMVSRSATLSARIVVWRLYAVSAVGEVWVVDEAGELEDGGVADRDAGEMH